MSGDQNYRFEDLPGMVAQLTKKVDMLLEHVTSVEQPERRMTIKEAGERIGVSSPTVHRYINYNDFPVHRNPGANPYCLESEVMEWVKCGKRRKKVS